MLLRFLLAAEGAANGGTPGTQQPASDKGWIVWVIFGVMIVGMILLTVLPNRKRRKEYQQMQNDIHVGTKIMTIGRMIGVVTKIYDDNTLELDVGTPGNPVIITITREAIGSNLTAQNEMQAKMEAAKNSKNNPAAVDVKAAEGEENTEVEGGNAEVEENPVEESTEAVVNEQAVENKKKDEDDAI